MAFDLGGVSSALDLIGRVAVLAAVVALYPLARRLLSRRPRLGDEVALGLLLGAGIGIAMLFPGPDAALGTAIAGIGAAGLLAGPIGAGLAATLGVLAFSAIELTGTLPGLAALLAGAPLGRLLARLAMRQRRTIGTFDLVVLGAILAFVTGVAHGGVADVVVAAAGAIAAGALVLAERTSISRPA